MIMNGKSVMAYNRCSINGSYSGRLPFLEGHTRASVADKSKSESLLLTSEQPLKCCLGDVENLIQRTISGSSQALRSLGRQVGRAPNPEHP